MIWERCTLLSHPHHSFPVLCFSFHYPWRSLCRRLPRPLSHGLFLMHFPLGHCSLETAGHGCLFWFLWPSALPFPLLLWPFLLLLSLSIGVTICLLSSLLHIAILYNFRMSDTSVKRDPNHRLALTSFPAPSSHWPTRHSSWMSPWYLKLKGVKKELFPPSQDRLLILCSLTLLLVSLSS